jgi:hypothetical protein
MPEGATAAETQSFAASLANLIEMQEQSARVLHDHIAQCAQQQAALERLFSETSSQPLSQRTIPRSPRSRDGPVPALALEGSTAVRAKMGLLPRAHPDALSDDLIAKAQEVFVIYGNAGTTHYCVDASMLRDILRVLGSYTATVEDASEAIEQHALSDDERGLMRLQSFFSVFRAVSQEAFYAENHQHNLLELCYYGQAVLPRWMAYDGEATKGDVMGLQVPALRRYPRLLVTNKHSETLFYFSIVVAALNSGVQTYNSLKGNVVVDIVEFLTLSIFGIEMLSKIMAESCAGLPYWLKDRWNQFDMLILVCLVVIFTFDKGIFDSVSVDLSAATLVVLRMMRLLRVLRILRAIEKMPELVIILQTLIRTTKSVAYIGVFTFLFNYIFAIIGSTLFGRNDPFHFGNVGRAMVSLFRVASLEDWTDIMYFQMYGCKHWGEYHLVVEHDEFGSQTTPECVNEQFPYASPIYFVM